MVPTTEIVPKAVHEAPAAPERVPASPELSGIPDTPLPEVGPGPMWQALLDVSVWRSRPWWLRVAASVVVKRLNRWKFGVNVTQTVHISPVSLKCSDSSRPAWPVPEPALGLGQ